MFVEIDSVSCVLGGGGERKHEVRDGTCPGDQHPKTAGVEAELCNEEGVMGEGGDSDGVGDEAGNDVVVENSTNIEYRASKKNTTMAKTLAATTAWRW